MKNVRRITQSLILAGLCSTGVAMAQSGPTTPSNTPNDTTGVQPNKERQPGTMAPAPKEGSTPSTTHTPSTTNGATTPGSHGMNKDGMHGDGRGKAPSDAGNTNVSPTQNMQGGSAPYTPGQK